MGRVGIAGAAKGETYKDVASNELAAWVHILEQASLSIGGDNEIERQYFETQFKAEVLLVKAGLKPAIVLYRSSEPWSHGEPEKSVLDLGLQDRLAFVRRSGLRYSLTNPILVREANAMSEGATQRVPPGRTERVWHEKFLFIAYDNQALTTIEDVYRRPPVSRLAATGLALGYPVIAVEAFIEGNTLSEEELYGLLEDQPEVRLVCNMIPFRFSRDHWKDELSLMQQYTNTLKRLSPTIYNDVLRLSPTDLD